MIKVVLVKQLKNWLYFKNIRYLTNFKTLKNFAEYKKLIKNLVKLKIFKESNSLSSAAMLTHI